MSRVADSARLIAILLQKAGMSNSAIKSELDITDDRYRKVRNELLLAEIIEPYRCRGGGIRLTDKGKKSKDVVPEFNSQVTKEEELYEPLVKILNNQSKEDEINSIVINSSKLMRRGKWQNPDITQIVVENYEYLRKSEIIIRTFEIKQWAKWDASVVYEAASHKRFSHEAIVLLEWPKDLAVSVTDPTYKLDEISRECRRFGIGLSTLKPHYTTFRVHQHIEPERRTPNNSDIEEWLEFLFDKSEDERKRFMNFLPSR